MEHKTITSWEEWEKQYKPIQNHISNREEYNGWYFETYGGDLEFILTLANGDKAKTVWTLLADTGEYKQAIVAGYHLVNRFGYFVTEVEAEMESIEVIDEDDREDEDEILELGCAWTQALQRAFDVGQETHQLYRVEIDREDDDNWRKGGRMKNTFEDFEKAIGAMFKVVDNEGHPFTGLMGQHDVIKSINKATQEIEGDKFIAHYSVCRFIQEVPDSLKK